VSRALLPLAICLAGCASLPRYDHGVPNLVKVRDNLYRAGQPDTPEAWKYLASLGVTDDVKLDFVDEGDDALAEAYGITVHYVPIEPTTRPGVLDLVEDVFAMPDPKVLAEIAGLLGEVARGGGKIWLVHCKNGHDRTGFVVGMARMVADGWDRHHAWNEMLSLGYHPELIGLDRSFHEFKPEQRK